MPQVLLTEIVLRNLKAPERGQVEYFDTLLTGFACRVAAGGAKSFSLLYGKNPRKRATLGRYGPGGITLAQARKKAADLLAAEQLGIKAEPTTITFEDARTLFFTAHVDQKNRARTAVETKRLLNNHFSDWEKLPLNEITTQKVSKGRAYHCPNHRRGNPKWQRVFWPDEIVYDWMRTQLEDRSGASVKELVAD